MRLCLCFVSVLTLVACADKPTGLPVGTAAYEVVPATAIDQTTGEYRIGPLDQLRVDVFQEPDLSLQAPVDINGNIAMPLIGPVRADGRTAAELSTEIASRLERLLVSPRVAVNVMSFASKKITVEGEVKRPGLYEVPGQVTLLQAVALAQGTSEFAKLNEVIVFRRENGALQAAQFSLADIRRGGAPDPTIRSGDIVVMGYSRARQIFRDILTVLPGAAGIFVALNQNN